MASATVHGAASSSLSSVDFVGSNGDSGGGGGGDNDNIAIDSSPDAGGHLSLYDDGDQSQHSTQPQEDETTVGSDGIGQTAPTATASMSSPLKRPSSAQSPPTTTQDSVSGVSMASQERPSSKKRRKQSNPVRLTANTARVCDTEGLVEFASADAVSPDDDRGGVGVIVESSSSATGMTEGDVTDNREEQRAECSGGGGGGDDDDDDDDDDHHQHHHHHRHHHQQQLSPYRCLHCNILFESEDQLRDHVEEEHVQRALEQQLQQQNQNNLFSGGQQNRFEASFTLPRTSIIDCPSSTATSTITQQQQQQQQDVKPDLDQLNCALQQHAAVSNLSQAAAMAALQNSKDVANLMALSAFGAAPFLIPIVPSSPIIGSSCGSPRLVAATSSNCGGTMTTNSNAQQPPPIRIFNPEAFCEHCNKEFCNKYFLKIHKANKHGIYSLEVLAGAAAAASASSAAAVASSLSSSLPVLASTSRGAGAASSASSAGSSFSCLPQMRPLLQTSPPIMNENGGGNVISSNCGGGIISSNSSATNLMLATSMANSLANGGGGGGLIITPSMLGKALPTVMNPDAFCDICQKEFCNKYFLRKHRYKIHGIQEPHSTSINYNNNNNNNNSMMISSSASNPGHYDCVITTLSASDMVHHQQQQHTTSASSLSGISSHIALPNSSSHAELCFELGARDLSAKIAAAAALMQQTPAKHSIQQIVSSSGANNVSTSTSPNTTAAATASCAAPTELIANSSSKMATSTSTIFPPGSVTVAGHVFSPDRLREMGVINLDAFCEICCKEFCNKYFLRTHKANKHGIGTCSSDMSMMISGGFNATEMMSKGSASSSSHHHHQHQQHKYQSVPLSLVMENKDGCVFQDGRKSATPNSNSSSSSTSSSSNSSGSGCLAHQSNGHQSMSMQTQLNRDAVGLSPELNCDMCNRPFSSVYLLKMHMFYFHNVGDIATMMPTADTEIKTESSPPLAPLKMMTSSSPSPSSHNQSDRGGSADILPTTGSAEKSSTPVTPTTAATAATPTPSAAQPLSEDLQKLQTMISELNTSPLMNKDSGAVKCNICFRDMKNKYFLRAHFMNEHGELHDEDMEAALDLGIVKREPIERDGVIVTASACATTPAAIVTSSVDGVPQSPQASSTPPPPQLSPPVSIKNSISSTSAIDLESFCDLCGKEFCNKYFVQAHKHSAHGVTDCGLGEKSSDSPPPSQPMPMMTGNDSCSTPVGVQQQQQPIPLDKIKTEVGSLPLHALHASNNSPLCTQSQLSAHHHHQHLQVSLALERSHSASSVIGRNFCEICNKELCNKYFMKTHMLKMHGINVDEKSFVNGATIGGVTCDICQKELCSKYFLKVHKQNTHGIQDEPLTNKENYGVGMVGPSIGHSADNAKDFPLGYHPGEVDGSGNRYFSHYTEVCPLCERRFKSIKWLKTHIVNDHADLAKESGFGDLFGELLFGAAGAAAEAAHLGQMRGGGAGSHHFLLSPSEMNFTGSNKGDKMSSTSSSSNTSPNTTSPFSHLHHQQQQHHHNHHQQQQLQQQQHHHHHHHHHQQQQHLQQQASQHSRHRSLQGHQENDVIGGGGTGGGGGSGGGAVVHELGSTGAAVGASGSALITTTALPPLPSPKMVSSGPSSGPRKPLTSGNGTRIYHCSYCTYSTRWLSNLYAHEKRHTGLSSEGEKRFSCRICHRAYRYNHSLQRHLISHKTSGLLLKHMATSNQPNLIFPSAQHIGGVMNHRQQHAPINCDDQQRISMSQQQQTSPGAIDCLPVTLPEHLQYRDDDEEEEEEEEEETAPAAKQEAAAEDERPSQDAKPFKLQKILSANSLTSSRVSNVGGKASSVSRVKKYRCSKCGAKYRTREQCLEHIHLYHNTRNRHQQHHLQQHHHQQQQQNQQVQIHHQQIASDSTTDIASDASQQQPQSSVGSSPPQQQQQQPPPTTVQHNCPRCTFSCNSREALVGHLARHHCGDDDEDDGRQQQQQNRHDDEMDEDEFMSGNHRDQDVPCFAGTRSQMPMTYAVPQTPPSAGSFIMQPFLMSQPDVEGDTAAGGKTPPSNTFVPSLVYLPVSHKVTDSVTVSFNLTPA